MDKVYLDLYGKVERLCLNKIDGTLLFIEKDTFMDYATHKLENGVTIISPTIRNTYTFYIKDERNQYLAISIRLQTVYHQNNSALKGNIEMEFINQTDVEDYAEKSTHLPCDTNKNFIQFIRTKEEEQIHYTVYLDNHVIGIVSEYGEHSKFYPDAEGMVFFDLDDENLIRKKQNGQVMPNTMRHFWQYQNLHAKAFPEYFGSIYSMQDREILAASVVSKNTFLIKRNNKAKGTEGYWLLKPTPVGKLHCIGDPFEMHAVQQKDLIFKADSVFCEAKNEILAINCEDTGKTLKIIRGFSVNDEFGYNRVSIKDFYSCLYINEELVTMYRHSP